MTGLIIPVFVVYLILKAKKIERKLAAQS